MSGRLGPLTVVFLLGIPARAWAGMPTITLDEVVTARLQTISFFLGLILVVTLVIQRGWNLYQRDQQWLPRLSYKGALGFVIVWALLLQLVLSMIGGARELMTPGAWVKVGATYALAETSRVARVQHVERLRRSLWEYAQGHDGRLPPHEFGPEIPETAWTAPAGDRFVYFGGARVGERGRLVLHEPPSVGRIRLVLYADGEVREVDARALGPAPR